MAECGTSDRLFIGLWLLVLAGMMMLAAGSLYLFRRVWQLLTPTPYHVTEGRSVSA